MKLKRLMILSLGVAMGFALISCGNGSGDGTNANSGTTANANTTTTTTTTDGSGSGQGGQGQGDSGQGQGGQGQGDSGQGQGDSGQGQGEGGQGQGEIKLNLQKAVILEKDSAFYGAMNFIIKDNMLDSIAMLLEDDMPMIIKPIYESGNITSFTFMSLDEDVFYNFKVGNNPIAMYGIKLTKTDNGYKIADMSDTIWVEAKNDGTFDKSATIIEDSSKTFADGTAVTLANNVLTITEGETRYNVEFNGLNCKYERYDEDKLELRLETIQDETNPLKLDYIRSFYNDDFGFVPRFTMAFELYDDYTVKTTGMKEFSNEPEGLVENSFLEYVKTDKGYNVNYYYVYAGFKMLMQKISYECLEGTNVPAKVEVQTLDYQSGEYVKQSETEYTYDDNLNLLCLKKSGSNGEATTTYTYENGKLTKYESLNENFSLIEGVRTLTNGDKSEIFYDSFENVTKEVFYGYDKEEKTYVKSRESIYTYSLDGEKQLSVEEIEYYLGEIANGYKHEFEYNESGEKTKDVESYYDTEDERYYKDIEIEISYDGHIVTTIEGDYKNKEQDFTKRKTVMIYNTDDDGYQENDFEFNSNNDDFDLVSQEVLEISDGVNTLWLYDSQEDLFGKEVTEFATNGLDTIYSRYDIDGTNETLTYKETEEYYDNGDLKLRKIEQLVDSAMAVMYLEECEYNNHGDEIYYKKIDYSKDGSGHVENAYKYEAEYDESFRITLEKHYYGDVSDNAKPIATFTWEYSKEGNYDKEVKTSINSVSKYVTTKIRGTNGLVSYQNDEYGFNNGQYYLNTTRKTYYDENLYEIKSETINYDTTEGVTKKTQYESSETVVDDTKASNIMIKYGYNQSAVEETISSGSKQVQSYNHTYKPVAIEAYIYNADLTTDDKFVPLMINTYEYNEDDKVTLITYGIYINGQLSASSYQVKYTYNDAKLKATENKYKYNIDSEEYDIIDTENTYVYDESGKKTDASRSVSYEYNEGKLIKKTTSKMDATFTVLEFEEYAYADGALTSDSRKVRYDLEDEDYFYESHWDPATETWGAEEKKPMVA